jgi:hypothetical protein
MRAIFRIERRLLESIHTDLNREHKYAAERVGFISCRVGALAEGYLLLAQSYHPLEDQDYEDNPLVGAMMGSNAIRKALQYAYNNTSAMFHVHRHEHNGKPRFSKIDVSESAKFIPNFWNVRPKLPHGTIVLSHDSMVGAWWNPKSKSSQLIDELAVIGRPVIIYRGNQ